MSVNLNKPFSTIGTIRTALVEMGHKVENTGVRGEYRLSLKNDTDSFTLDIHGLRSVLFAERNTNGAVVR